MKFKQFYLGCLSHASYYLGSDGEAAIIDPQRDVQQYIDEAAANAQQIKYIIETHSHADFVSGHVELAARTGAEIIYGRCADTQFPTLNVKDGDTLNVGRITLRFLETPGHTPESITIIAEDWSADTPDRMWTEREPNVGATGDPDRSVRAPLKIFTGDTLFIGDVGRPDLIGSKGHTAEEMAALLYDSLHDKILPLPDDSEIYPAHGAGSMCGKSLSKETWSTLGNQRKFNYALQPMSKEEFVSSVTSDQTDVPMYFPVSAAKNRSGSALLADLPKPAELSSREILDFGGVPIDVRADFEYGAGHVANSINIGLGGQFASWAGTLIPMGTRIAIVADNPTQVEEAVTRLARVGHESVVGFILVHNYDGDKRKVGQVSVEEVSELTQGEKHLQFVDVRRSAEHAAGHAYRTVNIPLDKLAADFEKLDPTAPVYVICQGGYRSSIGTSLLENAGFKSIYNVTGGTAAWIEADLPSKSAGLEVGRK